MPDFKLWDPAACREALEARDYPDAARRAIKAMHEQVGVLRVDEDGIARRGVLVRHLVMPGMLGDTGAIMGWLSQALSPTPLVNLMDQYHPAHKATSDARYSEINRRLTDREFSQAFQQARAAGLWRFDSR